MYECVPLRDQDSLREFYPLIEEACERLSSREGRDHFAPEVYASLRDGLGVGFVVLGDDGPCGFFAVQRTADSEDRPALQLWLGYARPGAHGAFECGLKECELIAMEEGRKTLVLGTRRRGWVKHAPRFGFELRELVFEKAVCHGR